MKTIQATVTVDHEHRAILQLPADVLPGEHRLVMVIDDPLLSPCAPLEFSAHDVGPWPIGLTLRREDLYDDSGRRGLTQPVLKETARG